MAELVLQDGGVAVIDDEDFERVRHFKWRRNKGGYVIASRWIPEKKHSRKIFLHRVIMSTPCGYETDHRNHDKLNNQKTNLRVALKGQNQGNQKARINSSKSSRYKGVSWHKHINKWHAQLRIKVNTNIKQCHLGYFVNEIEAAKAYDKAAINYFGEFALTNAVLHGI